MKVQFDKTFPMPASADAAWTLLQDVEAVAGCMPGARITERIDARHYKGTVAVKFGPASMSFRGDVEVQLLEPESRTLRMAGKGTDATGTSGASMDLTAHVDAVDAASCTLVGASAVSVSGKAAAFGARMMTSVADQVLQQFAKNFAAQLEMRRAQTTEATQAPVAPQNAARSPALHAAAAPTDSVQPLNGAALLWGALKDWLHSVFAHRAPRR